MDNLFQKQWYGAYWLNRMMDNWIFWAAIAVVIIIGWLIMRRSRR